MMIKAMIGNFTTKIAETNTMIKGSHEKSFEC